MGHAGNAVASPITDPEWIATGFALAMTRVVFYHEGNEGMEVFKHVIARRTEWTTRQSIVYRGILSKDAVRLLWVSGSPRAFSPRDDKSG